MLFSFTNELKILELVDAETDPTENLQDNSATPPVGTEPALPHSPLEETLVASTEPPSFPRVEDGDAALQAYAGDLLDVRLLGADDMLFRLYQYWVQQNLGEYFDGRNAEDGK